MKSALENWNAADEQSALEAMLACCGSHRWASGMVAMRPIAGVAQLRETADRIWGEMEEPDWLEAFAKHPRIGEGSSRLAPGVSQTWSEKEQSGMKDSSSEVASDLAQGNREYERRFGFTYIVCATGKVGDEMLRILRRRLSNDRMAELKEAAEQQRQIMQIRIGKWLVS